MVLYHHPLLKLFLKGFTLFQKNRFLSILHRGGQDPKVAQFLSTLGPVKGNILTYDTLKPNEQ